MDLAPIVAKNRGAIEPCYNMVSIAAQRLASSLFWTSPIRGRRSGPGVGHFLGGQVREFAPTGLRTQPRRLRILHRSFRVVEKGGRNLAFTLSSACHSRPGHRQLKHFSSEILLPTETPDLLGHSQLGHDFFAFLRRRRSHQSLLWGINADANR